MEKRTESGRSWKRQLWGLVVAAILLGLIIYAVVRGRVGNNAYFNNLNTYEEI